MGLNIMLARRITGGSRVPLRGPGMTGEVRSKGAARSDMIWLAADWFGATPLPSFQAPTSDPE